MFCKINISCLICLICLISNCSFKNSISIEDSTLEIIEGQGEKIKKELSVDMFRYLAVDLNANVELIQSDSLIVDIEGYKNIVELVDIQVSNSHMVIKFKKKHDHTSELNIKIYVPAIQKITMNGSGKFIMKSWKDEDYLTFKNNGLTQFYIENLNKIKNLFIEINGSGSFICNGDLNNVHNLNCLINGSGNVNLDKLTVLHAEIELNGSGNVELAEIQKLDVNIIGSGNITYKGFPTIHKKIIGSGTLQQK